MCFCLLPLVQVGCQQWQGRKEERLFLPSCRMQDGRKQTSTLVGEGVELILGIWRCCGVVIQGGEAAVKAMLWDKLSWNKEQGKCRLSNSKALSISSINHADPSSAVDTQLVLRPLDPTSVVQDKQIYSHIPRADLPWLHIAATRWALRKAVFCKSYALAPCLLMCLHFSAYWLHVRSLKGKGLSIFENPRFFKH